MNRNRTHCDHYTTQDTPSFRIVIGDCTRPVNGHLHPTKCKGICKRYTTTAYNLKRALLKSIK